jgi:putative alpha-1,2-mannosidase
MLWMLAAADNSTQGACANRAQFWLRQMTSLLYRPGADYAVGDEDNGQMATWYLLSALGLYDLAPGSGQFVLGSPLFSAVSLTLPGGRTLNVTALNNCADCVYVQSVTWNGTPLTGMRVAYAQLAQGGALVFTMSETPPSGVPGGPNPRAAALQAEALRTRPGPRAKADFLSAA